MFSIDICLANVGVSRKWQSAIEQRVDNHGQWCNFSTVILCCLLCFPDDLSFFLLEGLRISQIGMLAVDSISMLPNSGVITPSSARQIFCKEKQHQL